MYIRIRRYTAPQLVALWRDRPLIGDAIWHHCSRLPSGARVHLWIVCW